MDRKPIRTKVDVTERAATNLAADSVFVADTEILLSIVSLVRWRRIYADAMPASGVDAYHCRHGCSCINLKEADLS